MSGDTLSGTWQVTDNMGAIKETLTVSASCGATDATYGYRSCTISSASCAPGTLACAGGDTPTVGSTFYAFEVPGTALFVQGSGGGHSELHVGFALDTSCSGVAGDYTFLHIGNDQRDIFGVYRVNADMSSIVHADFRMYTGACNGMGSGNCTATPTIDYSSGNGTGTGIESVTSNSCTSGVRTITLGGVGTVRVSQSTSGVFTLDLPSGNGGIVAFKNTTAANLNDFANKSLGGIAFPDNGSPELISATTGSVSGTTVPITSIQFQDGSPTSMSSPAIKPVTDTSSTATLPAYANYTLAPSGTGTYANNTTLQPAYPTPSTIPGLFKIDAVFGDAGRVVLMATKYNDKVLAFGAVYNWRQTPNAYVNSGAFILFEK